MSDPQFPPYTFVETDADGKPGRRWALRITYDKRLRLRDELGLDVGRVLEDGLTALVGLTQDCERLVGACWILVEEQAAAAGVSPEAFGRSFTGDALAAAFKAFVEGVIDFFHPCQREILRAALAKNEQIVTLAARRALDEIDVAAEAATLIGSRGGAPGF